MQKNTAVEDNKKKNEYGQLYKYVANFINIYRNIYTYTICDKNDSK